MLVQTGRWGPMPAVRELERTADHPQGAQGDMKGGDNHPAVLNLHDEESCVGFGIELESDRVCGELSPLLPSTYPMITVRCPSRASSLTCGWAITSRRLFTGEQGTPAAVRASTLWELNLGGNRVQELNLGGNRVQELNLGGNRVQELNLGGNRVQELNLGGNRVQELNLSGR